MWTKETSKGNEVEKCRYRISEYLKGIILDVGCGDERICTSAIGLDLKGKAASIRIDLSVPDSLYLFNDDVVDVVFSSHFLEDIMDYESMLKEIWRVTRPNGHLILYLPHKDFYPHVGEEGANINHKHDFCPEDIIKSLSKFASFKLIRNETYSEDNEYSFLLIFQKIDSGLINFNIPTEKKKIHDKSVVIVRYCGYGDVLIMSPLYRLFKEKGYHVIANIIPRGIPAIHNNPNIDEFLIQERNVIPNTKLKEYFEELTKKYGKVVNMCESLERSLLLEERDKEYHLSTEERHKLANINYSDRAMELAGLSERGMRPELYPTEQEETLGRIFREKNKDSFIVLWQLTGSSPHKLYPYAEDVIEYFTDKYKDIKFFLSGGYQVSMLEWRNKQVIPKLGVWDIRTAMVITKFVDLVVSPETGILNASGCFDTPKIGLLTHSSKENLTKYFINDHSIQSESECSSCHKLIHITDKCPNDKKWGLPICSAEGIKKERVIKEIESVYKKWKDKKG